MKLHKADFVSSIETHFIGPPLSVGKTPAILYLVLSDTASLSLDPFNQFPVFLSKENCRIFSMMIPGHEQGRDIEKAIEQWAKRIKAGDDVLTQFIENALEGIDAILATCATKIAVCGLSRGAFLATHLAARHNAINTICGFSPFIDPSYSKELTGVTLEPSLFLETHLETLSKKTIRYFIGNRDIRVGTDNTIAFVRNLAEKAFDLGIRSPKIELILYPSIGASGHGTPPEIFKQGAIWIKEWIKKKHL